MSVPTRFDFQKCGTSKVDTNMILLYLIIKVIFGATILYPSK